jgi:hypothetical protein
MSSGCGDGVGVFIADYPFELISGKVPGLNGATVGQKAYCREKDGRLEPV